MSEAWNERNFFGSSEKSFIPGMLSLSVGGSENTSWVLSPVYAPINVKPQGGGRGGG